jgi:hypothetical protein
MNRDGDLTQNPFPAAPDYQRWRRQIAERRRQEQIQRRWDVVMMCAQGVAVAVLLLIILIIFL